MRKSKLTDELQADSLVDTLADVHDVPTVQEAPVSHGSFAGKAQSLASAVIKGKPKAVTLEQRTKYSTVTGLRKETLNRLLPKLPPVGTDIYILSNGSGAERHDGSDRGSYDFGTFIPYLVDRIAPTGGASLYVSTWTMNMRAADSMVDLIQRGRVASLTLCVDPYFNAREAGIAQYLLQALQANDHHYIAFKNHAKVLLCANPDESHVAVVTGSANLSSQPRVEQYTVSTSPELFRFFRDNLFHWAIEQLSAQLNS